jgi:hypothetical protein
VTTRYVCVGVHWEWGHHSTWWGHFQTYVDTCNMQEAKWIEYFLRQERLDCW